MPTRTEEAVLVPLDAATDPSLCGHKAAALAALLRDGFDVPNGFVIPVGTEPALTDIAAGLARLGDRPVAVRSSGVAEDLPDASYAGQYDTVLGVRGAEAVAAAASRVLASARSTAERGLRAGDGAASGGRRLAGGRRLPGGRRCRDGGPRANDGGRGRGGRRVLRQPADRGSRRSRRERDARARRRAGCRRV